ncbi:uncharacterized protein LOC134855135 [Symsagittifera roscoffensis]|uniref:uncharacterized protein LOC134855135 n=1 Tax=Symsagittifera roscoffensis TaxID=84072 RepID=UPI00307BAA42
MAEVVTLIHSPTSSTNENSNFLEIIPEDENEEEGTEESGSAGDLSSGRPMFLKEKGEQPSYIESINPNLPQSTKQNLLKTFGPFWATHFINPDAPPVHHIRKDAVKLDEIEQDADIVWDALRLNSLHKLQYQDFMMGPQLRKTFGAYTRQVQHNDLVAAVPRNLKPLRRFFYWDSETGKEVPSEDIFPADQSYKIRLENKQKKIGFAHAASSANQNMSELLMYNNQPMRYSVEVEMGGKDVASRLVREADLFENKEERSKHGNEKGFMSHRPKTHNDFTNLVFATERQLSSRPTFAAKHKAASTKNKLTPPQPLVSRVDHSAIASARLFSAKHQQVEGLMKDERFKKEHLKPLRKSSAPAKQTSSWNPLTLAEIVDTIDLSASKGIQSTLRKPLSAS